MSGLIDTHCHLDLLDDLEAALETARQAEVVGMVTIGTRWSRKQDQLGLLQHSSPELRIWCAIGTHPDHAHEERLPELDEMEQALSAPGVVAVGEAGLDYFHGTEEVRPAQHATFRRHIEAARVTGLPLVIHARQADDDVAAILRDEHAKGAFPFLLHCFAAGPALAQTALELGGYISFSGLLTFPKCEEIRAVARDVPEERLLVETDSPYLAPVPKRGKPNTPGYVAHTAARLAEVRGMENERLRAVTTENAYRLFSRARP
ncbi:YchF/TatD family DNA exonuclease [Saccharibacter sp. 17.LH.SD]|uniref:TatD family hydrolase n=1 Tax=Saccharibacter sp. 17.LH.SD TaxID=2689393 RepID=UPI001367D147|nr:TatD family hydrolase [Saccharibacter sp. 17.LH.SD]MXV44553.1 YchF/TatD family DNA exonuclease [Saccharibacter sp. 17.LH.SD]